MKRRQKGPSGTKKVRPAAFAAAGNIAIARFNATRHLLPKCGAIARSTGEPCRRVAMENGRCHYHGGRTPKGKDWHRRQWKQSDTPNSRERFERKLQQTQKSAAAQAARLAKMTPDERAAYDKWHRDRPIGSPAQRAAKKLARKQNEEARARFAQGQEPKPESAEAAAIRAQIEELEARRAAIAAAAAAPDPTINPQAWDIFG